MHDVTLHNRHWNIRIPSLSMHSYYSCDNLSQFDDHLPPFCFLSLRLVPCLTKIQIVCLLAFPEKRIEDPHYTSYWHPLHLGFIL